MGTPRGWLIKRVMGRLLNRFRDKSSNLLLALGEVNVVMFDNNSEVLFGACIHRTDAPKISKRFCRGWVKGVDICSSRVEAIMQEVHIVMVDG